MNWPYHFVDLSKEELNDRRVLLDRYGVYAQLSALAPILAFQLYRLGNWVSSERRRTKVAYSEVPTSPALKQLRNSSSGVLVRKWRSTLWWLEGEVAPSWGLRGHWIAAGAWTLWLLFLCIHRTGDDYLHATKRFGEVAVSQFPLHYMLFMKSRCSPLALLFRSSHEQLNPWHRMLGRIIYGFLLLHGIWYLNFFVQAGILSTRITAPVVVIGIAALAMLTIIATSSLEIIRRWSYRVFFILHLTIGVTIMPLLWFHASHLRYYVVEAFALFVIDIVARKLDTVTEFARITKVPHTKLLKLQVPIPATKIGRFKAAPGQHVYLSIPPESAPTAGSVAIHNLLFNPFTVAAVSENDITLVLRTQSGPTTKALDGLARLSKARPPINIEGPYGTTQRFPNLAASYDRVLLVAGGVGATFILPIYHSVGEQMEAEGKSSERLTLAWSMRSAAEASWAMDLEEGRSLSADENAKIFFTRSNADDREHHEEIPVDGSVEMDELDGPQDELLPATGRQRPDLRKIVDAVFSHGSEESVAVIFCGPAVMARDLRQNLSRWVDKGRSVWYHDEAFGW
ncbi:ferric reductase like transmembrane component [Phlyctema vagabunda]|uniref:Ferric reductase like transmembrane component n=1 Tax=Phlyctema vagabunda TaxID=108571 RepID=A0ABR4PSG4_9HELO